METLYRLTREKRISIYSAVVAKSGKCVLSSGLEQIIVENRNIVLLLLLCCNTCAWAHEATQQATQQSFSAMAAPEQPAQMQPGDPEMQPEMHLHPLAIHHKFCRLEADDARRSVADDSPGSRLLGIWKQMIRKTLPSLREEFASEPPAPPPAPAASFPGGVITCTLCQQEFVHGAPGFMRHLTCAHAGCIVDDDMLGLLRSLQRAVCSNTACGGFRRIGMNQCNLCRRSTVPRPIQAGDVIPGPRTTSLTREEQKQLRANNGWIYRLCDGRLCPEAPRAPSADAAPLAIMLSVPPRGYGPAERSVHYRRCGAVIWSEECARSVPYRRSGAVIWSEE